MIENFLPVRVILVAAGRGTRLESQGARGTRLETQQIETQKAEGQNPHLGVMGQGRERPKQYRFLAGQPVLSHILQRLGKVVQIEQIVSVIHPDDHDFYEEAAAISGVEAARLAFCYGGATRQESVYAGLQKLNEDGFAREGIVLVHDAARPLVSEAFLLRAILAGMQFSAAIPVLPVVDTLAALDADGYLEHTPDRSLMRLVQTPQVFRFFKLLDAHQRAQARGETRFTDDASLFSAYCGQVASFAGEGEAFKITRREDFIRAEQLLMQEKTGGGSAQAAAFPLIHTGMGYDVHAFTQGDYVMLGGVNIPHEAALLGHSDADPLLHAITDALLGTIGDGDIGVHFPPSDPQWRGAASSLFVREAVQRVVAAGGVILHADATIVCEAPKIGTYRAQMQVVIGDLLGVAPHKVGIKATTSEKLGFTGRKEGIAALAVVNVLFRSGKV